MVGDETGKEISMSKDKNSYLMWVGSDNYSNIDEWVDEVERLGVSKRLPNVSVAQAMGKPNTVVFVAHDEGEWKDCPECIGIIENPEWRKKAQTLKKLVLECESLESEIDDLGIAVGKIDGLAPASDNYKKILSMKRMLKKREDSIEILKEEMGQIDEEIEAGTGGSAWLINVDDGVEDDHPEMYDYRKYDYWKHQPLKFKRQFKLVEEEMCTHCGGKGQLPIAKVFGLFVPDQIEYILKDEDDETVKKAMEGHGFKTIGKDRLGAEHKRKCGYRHQGGVYITSNGEDKKEVKRIVKELVNDGVVTPDGIEVKGGFIKFINPVVVNEKRFRGIKRWNVSNVKVQAEADMIIDALE